MSPMFSSVTFSNFVTSFTAPSTEPAAEGCGNINSSESGTNHLLTAALDGNDQPSVDCHDRSSVDCARSASSDDRDDGFDMQIEAMKAPAPSFGSVSIGRSASASISASADETLPYAPKDGEDVPQEGEEEFRQTEAAAAHQAAEKVEEKEEFIFDPAVFETAEAQIGAVRKQTKELVLMLFRMKCDKDVLHKELNLTRDAVDRFDQKAHAEAAIRADFDRQRAAAEDEIAQLRDTKQRLEEEINERRQAARTAESEVRAAQMMVSGLDRSCDDLEQYLDGAGVDMHASSQSLSLIRTKTKSFREEFTNLKAERDRLAREVEESKRQSISTTSTFIEMITEMARAQAVIERNNYDPVSTCGSRAAVIEDMLVPTKVEGGANSKDVVTVSKDVIVKLNTVAVNNDVKDVRVKHDSVAVKNEVIKQKEDKTTQETLTTLQPSKMTTSPKRSTIAPKKIPAAAPPHWRPSPPRPSHSNVENSRDDDDVARSGSIEFAGAPFAGNGASSPHEDDRESSIVDTIAEEPGSEDDAGSGSGWDAMSQIVRSISPTTRKNVRANKRDGHDGDGFSTGSSSYGDDDDDEEDETAGEPSVQATFTDHDTASYTDTDDSTGLMDIQLSYEEEDSRPGADTPNSQLDATDTWGDDVHDRPSSHARVHMVEMHRTSTEKTENVSPRVPSKLRKHHNASTPAKDDHKFETLEELRSFMNDRSRGLEQHGDSDVFLNGYESTEEVKQKLDATLQDQRARVGKFNNLEELRNFYAQRRQGSDIGRSHGSTLALSNQKSLDVTFNE